MQHLPRQFGNHLIPQIGHPPIALWDIKYGLELTSGGIFVGWRDVIAGVQLCPVTQDQVTEAARFSGGRRALAFNGTSQGIRGWLESMRRTNAALAMHFHFVAADDTTTQRNLGELSIDGGTRRLQLYHSATGAGAVVAWGDSNASNATGTGWAANTELVFSVTRVTGETVSYAVNGVGVQNGDDYSTGAQQNASDLIVGHSANATNANFFYGSIRRIAVYNQPHDDTEAAIIDAAWRGL